MYVWVGIISQTSYLSLLRSSKLKKNRLYESSVHSIFFSLMSTIGYSVLFWCKNKVRRVVYSQSSMFVRWLTKPFTLSISCYCREFPNRFSLWNRRLKNVSWIVIYLVYCQSCVSYAHSETSSEVSLLWSSFPFESWVNSKSWQASRMVSQILPGLIRGSRL